jgi:hypothetical protein
MKRKFAILLISLVVCISGALCISAYPKGLCLLLEKIEKQTADFERFARK